MRCRSAFGLSRRERAAASSMARGRPSSRRQRATTSSTLAGVRANVGLTILARRTKRSTAPAWTSPRLPSGAGSGTVRGATGYCCSSTRCSGRREVARTRSPGTLGQQPADDDVGVRDLFEVVEHEEGGTVGEELQGAFLGGLGRVGRGAHRVGDRRPHQHGSVVGGQGHEVRVTRDPVLELARHRDGEPGLPRPAGAGQGHQPNAVAVDHRADLRDLPRAPDQLGRVRRQARLGAQAAQRGVLVLEAGTVDVEEVLRFGEVLQPVPPEVAHPIAVAVAAHQLLRGRGEHDLTAMGRAGDPGGPVDVDADVVVVVPLGLTGVQPDPHPQGHLFGPVVLPKVRAAPRSLPRARPVPT